MSAPIPGMAVTIRSGSEEVAEPVFTSWLQELCGHEACASEANLSRHAHASWQQLHSGHSACCHNLEPPLNFGIFELSTDNDLDLCTLLEQAKGTAFYDLFGELADLVSEIAPICSAPGECRAGLDFDTSDLRTLLDFADKETFHFTCRELFFLLSAGEGSAIWETGVSMSFCESLCRP